MEKTENGHQANETGGEAAREEIAAYATDRADQGKTAMGAALAGVKDQLGPPSADSIAARAARRAAKARVSSPQEIAAAEEARRKARDVERELEGDTARALDGLTDEGKLVYLHALQTDYLLGNKPERFLRGDEPKRLNEARELLGEEFTTWPTSAKEPYYDGFPGSENPELRQGFEAWVKERETESAKRREQGRADRRAAMRACSEGTISLHDAVEEGEDGTVCLRVDWTVKDPEASDREKRFVPRLDEDRNPITRWDLVKLRAVGGSAYVSEKLDVRKPPHIHADPDGKLISLSPPNFEGWPRDMSAALVKAYAEGKEGKERREALAKIEDEMLEAVAGDTEITATTLAAGLAGEKGGRKTGAVVINNPGLLINPRNRNEGRFHLAFTISIGAKGIARLKAWHSSDEATNLNVLMDRELHVGLEDGKPRVTDPHLKEVEDEELASAIRRACGKVTGALRAQVAYERKRAQNADSVDAVFDAMS